MGARPRIQVPPGPRSLSTPHVSLDQRLLLPRGALLTLVHDRPCPGCTDPLSHRTALSTVARMARRMAARGRLRNASSRCGACYVIVLCNHQASLVRVTVSTVISGPGTRTAQRLMPLRGKFPPCKRWQIEIGHEAQRQKMQQEQIFFLTVYSGAEPVLFMKLPIPCARYILPCTHTTFIR